MEMDLGGGSQISVMLRDRFCLLCFLYIDILNGCLFDVTEYLLKIFVSQSVCCSQVLLLIR